MEHIRKWLNERGSYQAGVDILLQHCPGHQLAPLFTGEAETPFKMKKLQKALQDLLHTTPAVKYKTTVVTKQSQTVPADPLPIVTKQSQKVPGRWYDKQGDDPVERSLHEKWFDLYLERNNLQARIYDIAKAGQKDPKQKDLAAQMALKILDLDRQIKQIYDQRDHYFLTGSLPSEPEVEQYAQDPVVAARNLQNHQRYVRTFKKQLDKNPADEKARQLLNKHLKAVEHYKTFLKLN